MSRVLAFIPVSFSFANLRASSEATDLEFWTQGTIFADVSKKTECYFFSGFRWNENASNLFFKYAEMGFIFHIDDKWSIIPSYRQSFEKIEGCWEPEENPRFTFIRIWEKETFTFSNRSRFEYRSRRDNFLYRNQFRIECNIPFSDKLTPYLSEEFFLDKLKTFTQNRIQIGLETEVNKCLFGNFAYMFRWERDIGIWFREHVILCYLDLNF